MAAIYGGRRCLTVAAPGGRGPTAGSAGQPSLCPLIMLFVSLFRSHSYFHSTSPSRSLVLRLGRLRSGSSYYCWISCFRGHASLIPTCAHWTFPPLRQHSWAAASTGHPPSLAPVSVALKAQQTWQTTDLIIFYAVRTIHAHNNVPSTAFLLFRTRGVARRYPRRSQNVQPDLARIRSVSRFRAVSISHLLSGLASRQCLCQTQCPALQQHRRGQPGPDPSTLAASPCPPTHTPADHAFEFSANKRYRYPRS